MDLEKRIAKLSAAKLALLERKLKQRRPPSPQKTDRKERRRRRHVPLSFSQERLWFLEQMDPDSCLYNLPAMIPLSGPMMEAGPMEAGPVEPRLVEECLRLLVSRHSALRTRFVVKDDSPRQVIEDDVSDALDFSTLDLRGGTRVTAASLQKSLNDEVWVPFNLATGPLLRVRLFLQRNQENFLLVVMHHIVSDGWSINIFTREFRTLYETLSRGRSPELPELPQQYVDYALSQREALKGKRLQSLLSYWRDHLDGAPSLLQLPLDRPRPARQSFAGALLPFTVGASSLEGLKALCRECGAVPFMVLLSVFKVLLFRYTHQPKIVVGTPIANRNRSELEGVIGFFTNTLVLCNFIEAAMSFRELLTRVRETTLGAYEHQDLPFEKLVSELQPQRSLSHNPLFQVMFTFQNLPTEKSEKSRVEAAARSDEETAESAGLEVKLSKFDLTLAMTQTDTGLSAVFEYATHLFEEETIERLAGHFVNTLEYLLRNPDRPVGSFSFLASAEKEKILREWNDTTHPWEEVQPLHGRFERRAQQQPDSPALVFQDEVLTYREVDRRADRIARELRGEGVERGDIVGICLYRSLEMVVGLYGILKAGAAYLPIEPDLPEERIAYMLSNAGTQVVLTTSQCLPGLSPHGVRTLVLDELVAESEEGTVAAPEVEIRPGDLAYVLFTSGSTGEPKGVMVSHGAIANRLYWMQERYRLTTDDRVMQKTPFSFDVSVWEFFWPLSEGASLVLAEPERHKEAAYLVDLIKAREITCLHFVPSMLQLFLHEDLSECKSLKRIICSGEALTVEQCRRLNELPGVSAHNLYGPTEAAVDVTHWDCDQWHDQYLSVPIGRPIANTRIYILTEELQPSPIGVSGELHIGGHNLAEGYLGKPELTREKFIADPFVEDAGARLYKTGDLARFRSDGTIEYIGRVDSQIKLRGLRIELGEIEFHLRQYPGIAEAVVVVRRFGDFDERLVAYIVPEDPDQSPDTSAISALLGEKLPNYMVPSAFATLASLPLTPSGKLDRKRLPEPTVSRASEALGPVTDIERELLGFWRKFLKTDAVGVEDDFFAAGGHSILGTQMINSISRHYHLHLPIRLLFEKPTVKALAKALSEFEDEAWLEESKTAASLLMSSNRRLLQTLDELSEDDLDELLAKHLDDTSLTHLDDIDSLLAWSAEVPRAPVMEPRTGDQTLAPESEGESDEDPVSLNALYFETYFGLSRTRAALESLALGGNGLPAGSRADGRQELASSLQIEGAQLFEDYVRTFKSQLVVNGSGALHPRELWNLCGQMLHMAHLAAIFIPPRPGAEQAQERKKGSAVKE